MASSKDSTTTSSAAAAAAASADLRRPSSLEQPQPQRPLPFYIDLNEVPSSPSSEEGQEEERRGGGVRGGGGGLFSSPSPGSAAYEAVKNYLGTPKPDPRGPVNFLTEVRNGSCVCGRAEARGGVVVCDGCERWFHLSCAGLRSRQAYALEDWMCNDCLKRKVDTKRWKLGPAVKGTVLDINSEPPSDGEGEAAQDLNRVRVLSSDMEIMEPGTCNTGATARVTEAGAEEIGGCESQQLNDGFPIQYEDFFVLRLGDVDMRPSYHISTQIWPVGYQCSWHDMITRSLFTCRVLDGGDSGPIFKVRRSPCSTSLMPNGSTILSRVVPVQSESKGDAAIATDIGLDEYDPMEQDVCSLLGSGLNEAPTVQTLDALLAQSNGLRERSATLLPENAGVGDEIGEFFVEGRSSSLVWTKVSETLIDACREVYKQSGILHFYCKHGLDGTSSAAADGIEHSFGALAKFCSSSSPFNIPRVVQSDNELDASCQELKRWLNQDRFGLDVEFVQEIIEQLPGSFGCSEYEFLSKRKDYSTSVTVGSGLLTARRKSDVSCENGGVLGDLLKGCKRSMEQDSLQSHEMDRHHPPPLGRPLSSTLSANLSSDVLQAWEFLWRFSEILGMKDPLSFEELEKELLDPWFDDSNFLEKIEKEIQKNCTSSGGDDRMGNISSPTGGSDSVLPGEYASKHIKVDTSAGKEASLASRTYNRCTGVSLAKAHSSLLKILVSELQAKVVALVDPTFDTGESKSRRGRKKDVDNSLLMKTSKIELLPINEFTWPELTRRYILAVLSMDGNLDSSEINSREGGKVFRCLQGDGGVLCGSLTGVAGMEADALLLAEATKQVCGSLKRENDDWPMEDKDSDAIGTCVTTGATGVSGSNVPEWAQPLEPVRKLPTNVGTRIRKCVYEALEKGPPEWARKILVHSISKEVYKGNASGPTKKAVLSVLADVCTEGPQTKSEKGRKGKSNNTISGVIMKRCRIVLRRAAAADKAKTFCNLLGTTSLNPNANDDEGVLGSPAMVSRPLDFRTIDLRLAAGAYGGSHEAFFEDICEVWHNIRTAYGDQPEMIQLAETLYQSFESLYEKEVLALVQKCKEHANSECSNSGPKKELIADLVRAIDVPKAPWDEGVCKVCGMDKDDESVLLCDTCDSEYHTYCLVPPLARIPEGNWYCPSCVAGQGKAQNASKCARVMNRRRQKKFQGERSCGALSEKLNHLAVSMGEKEYWELSVDERVFLLKFLCDEALDSAIIREHLEQCADVSSDLQQRLRSLSVELKNLRFKEEIVAARATKESMIMPDGVGEAGRDRITTVLTSHGRWTGQRPALSSKYTYHMASTPNSLQLEDVPGENNHPYNFFSKGILEKHCNGSRSEYMKASDTGNQIRDPHSGGLIMENLFPHTTTQDLNRKNEQLLSTPQTCFDNSGRELNIQSGMSRKRAFDAETNGSALLPEFQGSRLSVGTSVGTARTHLTEHVAFMPTDSNNLFHGHPSSNQPGVNEPQAHIMEANSLKNEILAVQDSIASTELQLMKVSMRRDFLGSDSFGRLYWVLTRPGKRPWLVADGSTPLQIPVRENECTDPFASTSRFSIPSSNKSRSIPRGPAASGSCGIDDPYDGPYHDIQNFPSCVLYESDVEIGELVEWLVDSDPRERELKESILHFQRLRSQDAQQAGSHVQNDSQGTAPNSLVSETPLTPSSLVTKANTILEKKYGPCLESETIDIPKKRGRKAKITHEDRMYRCECLEPIWPSRRHCFSCHQTFCTNAELEGHNDGKCNSGPPAPDDIKENDEPSKGKRMMRSEAAKEEFIDEVDAFKSEKFDVSSRLTKFQKKAVACPYNFEEISKKFITRDSNKELVQGVGLIGSNGIPMLLPSTSPYIDDPTLVLDPTQKTKADHRLTTPEVVALLRNGLEANVNCNDINLSPLRIGGNGMKETLKTVVTKVDSMDPRDSVSSLPERSTDLDAGDIDIVPDSALRLLEGKNSQILRRLKINLLDMDAALPEEALRPSKAHSSRRSAWRAFTKSADSILEMIKAAIIFEDMIKTKYLRNGRWYWSSLSAAARTSTLSSLAFRIYALDASISYEKASTCLDENHPMDNPKSGKKRKECEV